MQTGEFKVIPLEQIVPSKTNPRKTFREDSLQELAESIKKTGGVVQPITVRPLLSKLPEPVEGKASKSKASASSAGNEPSYEIVAGERRYRATKLAGLGSISSMVRDLTDEEAMEVQIIENLDREDVNPMEEAIGFEKMLKLPRPGKQPYTIQELALRFSRSEGYIAQRLKFNNLIPEFKKKLLDDEILVGHALELCRLEVDDQKEVLEKGDWETSITTPKALKGWILKNIVLNLSAAPFKKDDPNLLPKAGSCAECPKRSGFNQNLFHDIQEKDRCFDKRCYEAKIDAFVHQKQSALKSENESFKEISHRSNIRGYYQDENDKKLLKKYPSVVESGNFGLLKEKEHCEYELKGLWVEGPQIGHVVRICVSKECKKHLGKPDPQYNKATADKNPREYYEQKIARSESLMKEKYYAALFQNVQDLPGYKTPRKLNASEGLKQVLDKAIRVFIWEEASYTIRNEHDKLGLKESNHNCFYDALPLQPQQEAWLFMRCFMDKYPNADFYSKGATMQIMEEIANQLGIDTKSIADELSDKQKKQVARYEKLMAEKLSALEAKIAAEAGKKTKAKKEAPAEAAKPSEKKKKGLAALLEEQNAEHAKSKDAKMEVVS